jgi:hypothetical protein
MRKEANFINIFTSVNVRKRLGKLGRLIIGECRQIYQKLDSLLNQESLTE